MKRKRAMALVLAICLLSGSLTVGAGAASAATTFSDLSDTASAADVECLRVLGVLDGYRDGTFRPDATLTRAQFCKMAVYVVNGSGELGKYRTMTIFPDVKPSYWGAAYVNMASKGKAIIRGYPDGRFYPDRTVTYGQAVTILMRLLGYADADMGGIWPEGYLAQASVVGLTGGLTLSGSAALTRAQAAALFGNLLRCSMKAGGAYAATIAASTVTNVVLVSSAATAPNGSAGAMQVADGTSSGTVYPMAYKQGSGLLNGRRGTLLLNKANEVLTFVPDATGSTAAVTLASAKADSLTDNTGRKYAMTSSVKMFYNGESKTYGEVYSLLAPGMALTLYFGSAGSVEYVFAGGSVSTAAVIVAGNGSTAGFAELAGGVTNYTIEKDGVSASAAALRQYDVATYDSAANVIRVSSNKITGYYENCKPNATAPTEVTVLGHVFKTLPSASESLAKLKLGSQITLLLTSDNQVAGAVTASGNTAVGNAVGLVTSLSATSATVQLLMGITVTGNPNLTATQVSGLTGQLVSVSSNKTGGLSLSKVGGGGNATLDVANRKVGSAPLADNVVIYEKVDNSVLTAINLSDITVSSVDASRVSYVRTNWAGQANLLILNDVTGNCYTYGRASVKPGSGDVNTSVTVTYGAGKSITVETGYACEDGSFVGVAESAGGGRVAGLVTLTKLSGVTSAAWNSASMVTVNGISYTVAKDLPCYNRSSDSWMTLAAARGFSSTANLYVDSHHVIRVMEVG